MAPRPKSDAGMSALRPGTPCHVPRLPSHPDPVVDVCEPSKCALVDRVSALEADHEDLEATVNGHETRLQAGSIEFVKVGKDIEALTEKVSALISVLIWVGGAIGVGLLGTAGSALLWVIAHMGVK